MENNNIAIDDEIRNYFNELLLKSGISVDEEKKEKKPVIQITIEGMGNYGK